MDLEAVLRGIAEQNRIARAEFGKLSARVISATLSGEGIDGIIDELAREGEPDLGEVLPEQGETEQLGGDLGDGESGEQRPGTEEESGSGI